MYKTKKEARDAYLKYIDNHIDCVKQAYIDFSDIIITKVCFYRNRRTSKNSIKSELLNIITLHDKSKYGLNEFEPYRLKYYPSEEDVESKEEIDKMYDRAWEHHYLYNRHHPEIWNEDGYRKMTDVYFIEMILDWIAISVAKKQNFFDHWFNSLRSEMLQQLYSSDIDFIDEFVKGYEDKLDFSIE